MRTYLTRIFSAGFAVTLGCSAVASAYNWCPTPNDKTITCSNCTVTLTCSPSSVGITLNGSNVTLDGNGNTLWYPSGTGVLVSGTNNTIKNLTVWLPSVFGIGYVNGGTGTLSVVNVALYFAKNQGYYQFYTGNGPSGGPVQFSGCTVYGNTIAGVVAVNGIGSVNTFNSLFQNNKGSSENIRTQADDYSTDNQYNYNLYGIIKFGTDGGIIGWNSFYGNTSTGLHAEVTGYPALRIYGNSGYNSGTDCHGANAQHLDVDGNSWGTNNGCIDK